MLASALLDVGSSSSNDGGNAESYKQADEQDAQTQAVRSLRLQALELLKRTDTHLCLRHITSSLPS